MARLVLSLDGQSLAEYNMSKERYTIGRLPDNDIRIDNAAVSGHHALIINILNDSFLEDLNSTNGTYVNGKIIKKHALQHGDSITVGHHTLRFVESEADEPAGRIRKDDGDQSARRGADADAARRGRRRSIAGGRRGRAAVPERDAAARASCRCSRGSSRAANSNSSRR